jgi:hypothetical protein
MRARGYNVRDMTEAEIEADRAERFAARRLKEAGPRWLERRRAPRSWW